MSISTETYAETVARAMANHVHSKGCGCKRCRPRPETYIEITVRP